ncbi:protein kinase [Bacillus timonensis]|nr:protein kinase [Bacillus timonensis]
MNFLTRIREGILPAHSILKHYSIKRILGMGSYGISYEAIDLKSGKTVVIKQLRKRQHHSKGFQSLQLEKEILQKLSHPNIPKYIEAFKLKKDYFLVMTKIDGVSLEDLLFEQNRVFSKSESFDLIYKAFSVVSYFQDQNIVHLDLRPPNILLQDEHLSIIDFGLSRFLSDSGYTSDSPMRRLTPKSDFYALGHTLLFLLYSNYTPTSSVEQSWENELSLSIQEKCFIRRLLQAEDNSPFNNVQEVMHELDKLRKAVTH